MDDLFSKKDLIYTIYRERSFSTAAKKLFIAQPSLSLTVKKLEDKLGLPLFDRSTKPISLTEAGKEYIAAVEAIRQVEQSFQNYLERVDALEAGSLSIGSNQLLSSQVLPKYISAFTRKHPGLQLSLVDANSTALETMLFSGQLDIVIDNHRLDPELYVQQHLTSEQLLLAVPAHFPENEEVRDLQLSYGQVCELSAQSFTPVPLSVFRNIPFILMNRDNDTRKQTDTIFHKAGFEPQVLFELDRLVTLYAYIQNGTAASVVSDTLVRSCADNRNICFYPLPHSRRDIFVSCKRNKYYSKAMSAFIQDLGDLC